VTSGRLTLLCLHGYTLNGTHMRAQLGALAGALAPFAEVVCPDAPQECPPASVERFYAAMKVSPAAPPRRTWWRASDDGLKYDGWETTRDLLRDLLVRHAPAGILGFSQGAMVAAVAAAASTRGELPELPFVVLVAGRVPRAEALKAFFDRPVAVPSLHVWGDRDAVTGPYCQELVEAFDGATREVSRWPGAHVVPTKGPAADAIVDFVRRRATGGQGMPAGGARS
jgi:predicted esterase